MLICNTQKPGSRAFRTKVEFHLFPAEWGHPILTVEAPEPSCRALCGLS